MKRFAAAWLLLIPSAQAATVCRQRSAGAILETTSSTSSGACQRDLIATGFYAEGDVEELTVTNDDRKTLIAAWEQNPLNPTAQKRAGEAAALLVQEQAIKTKLNLTDADFQAMKAVFRR